MGWWDIAGGIMGDGPADDLGNALHAFRDERAKLGLDLPTATELMIAFGAAVRDGARTCIKHGESLSLMHVLAQREDGSRVRLEVPATVLAPAPLVEFVDKQRAAYVDEFRRKPWAAELCHVFGFVVGAHPEEHVADVEDWDYYALRGVWRDARGAFSTQTTLDALAHTLRASWPELGAPSTTFVAARATMRSGATVVSGVSGVSGAAPLDQDALVEVRKIIAEIADHAISQRHDLARSLHIYVLRALNRQAERYLGSSDAADEISTLTFDVADPRPPV